MQSIPQHWSAQPAPNIIIRGDGAPVLLLHGWGASVELFQTTITGLERRYTLIAPDFPGFGQTPPPPAGWSVGQYADWVTRLLDDLRIERCSIIGHSFGGNVAIKLAVERPERIAGLVLTDAAGIRPAHTFTDTLRIKAFKGLRRLSTVRGIPKPLRARLQERVAHTGSADYRAAKGTVRESFVRVVNEDLTPVLSRITAPTLLIWGDQDQDTPITHAHTMERLIPDAGLVVFRGAGHYAYLEQPGRFSHIVTTFFGELTAW